VALSGTGRGVRAIKGRSQLDALREAAPRTAAEAADVIDRITGRRVTRATALRWMRSAGVPVRPRRRRGSTGAGKGEHGEGTPRQPQWVRDEFARRDPTRPANGLGHVVYDHCFWNRLHSARRNGYTGRYTAASLRCSPSTLWRYCKFIERIVDELDREDPDNPCPCADRHHREWVREQFDALGRRWPWGGTGRGVKVVETRPLWQSDELQALLEARPATAREAAGVLERLTGRHPGLTTARRYMRLAGLSIAGRGRPRAILTP